MKRGWTDLTSTLCVHFVFYKECRKLMVSNKMIIGIYVHI